MGDDSSCGAGQFTFEPGSLLGEIDFYLQQPHHYTAWAGDKGCTAGVITREAVDAMEGEDARLASLLQRICLRSVCMLSMAQEGLRQ